ncbi:hypothetical protein ACLB2K_018438 [Fragaria x ananassa]
MIHISCPVRDFRCLMGLRPEMNIIGSIFQGGRNRAIELQNLSEISSNSGSFFLILIITSVLISEFRITLNLSGYDAEFSDEDKAAILLASLPEKFNDLVMGMMYGKESVVFDHVVSLLLYKESKNAEVRGRVTNDQSCSGSKSSRSYSRNNRGKECYYSHEIGHILNHCPKLELKKRNKNLF